MRADWPIRRFERGDEPSDDLSDSTDAEQRLAMMWELAVTAWSMAGRAIPDFPRHETPIRIVRAPELG